MSEELTGNVLVAQAGNPTAVFNASLAGVVTEALNHPCIEEIYGAVGGLPGAMQEDLLDLAEESQQAIRGLRYTPSAALGTSRAEITRPDEFERVLEVFKAHQIEYFFYIGGAEAMATDAQLSAMAEERGLPIRIVGVPKSMENDLPVTDHCPGYASAAKRISSTVKELAIDHASYARHDLVSILEVGGRHTGWLAAAATMAKRRNMPEDPPHLILMPECPLDADMFVTKIQEILHRHPFCLIAAAEGAVDLDGNYLAGSAGLDAFGQHMLTGVGQYLREQIEQRVGGLTILTNQLGAETRAAVTGASQRDNDEAFLCGAAAVQKAVEGTTGRMIALIRGDADTYTAEIITPELAEIGGRTKTFPEAWISEDRVSVSYQFFKYCLPLIEGEVEIPYENGTPKFVEFSGNRVHRLLAAHGA